MADSTDSDLQVEILSLLGPEIIPLILGLLIHLFIIGTNVNDWWKRRSITPVDHIVTFLGISRIGIQCTDSFYLIGFELLMRGTDSDINMFIVDTVYFFSHFSNIWLTTLLFIVLCLKISNICTRLFLYLRTVILPRTGLFIVASECLAGVNSLMLLWMEYAEMTNTGIYNTTINCIHISSIINFTTGTIFPLLFYLLSSALLFSSLYHHTVKMKMSSNLSINLETYYSAMKLVFFTFIYNTMYLTGHFICAFCYYFYCASISWPYIVLDFLPVLHSSYLIYTTARLRSQMSEILQNLIAFIFPKKYTETGENIEVIAH